MPSCATMKPNRACFRGRKPETAQLSGFKTCNSFFFNKTPKETAHFQRFSGQRASRTRCNRGAIEWGSDASDELGLALRHLCGVHERRAPLLSDWRSE